MNFDRDNIVSQHKRNRKFNLAATLIKRLESIIKQQIGIHLK